MSKKGDGYYDYKETSKEFFEYQKQNKCVIMDLTADFLKEARTELETFRKEKPQLCLPNNNEYKLLIKNYKWCLKLIYALGYRVFRKFQTRGGGL
jgi:hypothetical protein